MYINLTDKYLDDLFFIYSGKIKKKINCFERNGYIGMTFVKVLKNLNYKHWSKKKKRTYNICMYYVFSNGISLQPKLSIKTYHGVLNREKHAVGTISKFQNDLTLFVLIK